MRPKDDFTFVDFGDGRLNKRLLRMVENSTQNSGKSILNSGSGRGEAKAFYRLLSNDGFELEQLQGVVSGSCLARLSGTVLLIQDTMDLNLNGHKKTVGLGYCSEHIKGIKVHTCMAASPDGIPFGFCDPCDA